MTMKRLMLVWVMGLYLALICCLTQSAFAITYRIDDRESSFVSTAESKYPGWRATYITWCATDTSYYRIVLLHAQDGMLHTRKITARTDDLAEDHWMITDTADGHWHVEGSSSPGCLCARAGAL